MSTLILSLKNLGKKVRIIYCKMQYFSQLCTFLTSSSITHSSHPSQLDIHQVYGHFTACALCDHTAWNTHPSEICACGFLLCSNLCSNVTSSMKLSQTLFKIAHPTSSLPSFFSFLIVLCHYLSIQTDMQIHADCLYTRVYIHLHTCTLVLIVCLWPQDFRFLGGRDACLL